jgi:hypothetical protein
MLFVFIDIVHCVSSRCCPLCYRKFDKQLEGEQLIRDMKSFIKGPEYRRKLDRDLTILQEKFEKCLNLKPIHKQLQELDSNELPTLRVEMTEIVELKSRQTTIENQLNDDVYRPIEHCEQIKADIVMLDKYIDEQQDFQCKIIDCQQKLGKHSHHLLFACR